MVLQISSYKYYLTWRLWICYEVNVNWRTFWPRN